MIKFISVTGLELERNKSVDNSKICYSVLIPAYNAEAYIEECLDSVLAQTHRNLQVVVIDDGSSDRTAEILDRYAAKDPRVEVLHRENRGVATTRLELFKMAKGKYINFVDADDTVEPEMAEVMIDVLECTKADVAVCNSTTDMQMRATPIPADGLMLDVVDGQQARREFLEHKRLVGALWNKVIRRSVCRDVTCPPEIRYGEDAVIFWQILKQVNTLVYVDAVLYHYRPNYQSVSRMGFSQSMMTGVIVWKTIVEDVSCFEPTLLDLARAQQCNQAAGLLYLMYLGKIRDKKWTQLLRSVVSYTLDDFNAYYKDLASSFRYFWCNAVVRCWSISRLFMVLRRSL